MKLLRSAAIMVGTLVVLYVVGHYLEENPSWKDALPYVFIAILYIRYETKIENLSLDLLSVEDQLAEVSKGEWEPNVRFRKNPFNPS